MKKLFLFGIMFFMFSLSVNAECDYESQATLQQAAFETPIKYLENGDQIDVYIGNFPSSLYIKVENEQNNFYNTYYGNSNGNEIRFNWPYISDKASLQITFYASSETMCADTEIRSTTLELPMFNEYSKRSDCVNNTSYVCSKFVNARIDDNTFNQAVRKDSTIKNEKTNRNNVRIIKKEEDKSFFEEYKVLIISLGVLVLFTTVLILLEIRRKRRLF